MKKLPKGVRLKNNSYEARATVNGIKICLHSKDLNKLLEQFEEAKEAARRKTDYRQKSVKLDEWFKEWLEEVHSNKIKATSVAPTLRRYQRTFGRYIGNIPISEILNTDVQRTINQVKEEGVAVSTIRSAVSNLKDCMDFAVGARYIDSNPCIAIVVPWEYKRTEEEDPYTQEEQDIFLKQLDDESNWYREMFYIMFLTGLRVGELGGLRWQDVDFKKKGIHIRHNLKCDYLNGVKTMLLVDPKTVHSYRFIPFMGEAEQMFLQQRDKVRKLKRELGSRYRATGELEDVVFVSTMGSPCTRYIVEKEIKKVTERIDELRTLEAVKNGKIPEKFKKGHPHLIRHTFATRAFEHDVDPKVVQKLMGHSNYTITMTIYTHVMEKKQLQEIAKMSSKCVENELPKFDYALPKITAKSHL